jgi:hypothetical protein
MKYENGKIYKIVSNQTEKIYVGSTCSPLFKRLYQHRSNYKRFLDGGYHFVSSFEIVKFEDNDIQLIENYPCNSKEELHAREGFHIRQLDCTNKQVAGRSDKQYRDDHKEKAKEYFKQYYEDNKNELKKKSKDYYYENKEKIAEWSKKYAEANKDKIKAKTKQIFACECGGTYSYKHKARHFKSISHTQFINQ